MLFNQNFLSFWISCSHWWKWNKIKLLWWRGCHERIGKKSKYYTGTTFGPFACWVSHKRIVEPVPSVLEDRDARTKTGWSLTGLGPDQDHQNFEPDQDQEKFQNLGPGRTRIKKNFNTGTDQGQDNFKIWDRTSINKILKILDRLGPVGRRRSVDPCWRTYDYF